MFNCFQITFGLAQYYPIPFGTMRGTEATICQLVCKSTVTLGRVSVLCNLIVIIGCFSIHYWSRSVKRMKFLVEYFNCLKSSF